MKGIRFKYKASLNYSESEEEDVEDDEDEEEDELFHDNLDEDQGKKEEGKKDEKEKKEAKQNGRDPRSAITKREAKKPKDISRDQACLDGPISYDKVFEVLESIRFPWQERKNISDDDVLGFNLGVTNGRGNGAIVGNAIIEREVLADFLGRFIQQHKPEFPYSSIQVNKNVPCNLHVDKNNLGASYIIGVGDYAPVYIGTSNP